MFESTLTADVVTLINAQLRLARLIMLSNAKIDSSSEPVVVPCVLLARSLRTDARTARVIYQALVLRDAFGPRSASAFATFHHIPAALWRRVLNRKSDAHRR